jgi:hypothetical protein
MEEINSKDQIFGFYAEGINFVKNIIIESDFISKSFLKERNWQCIPVETGLHFTEEDASRISKVCKSLKITYCLAVLTEELSVSKLFKLGTSREDFLKFNYECGGFNYALVPDSKEFIISCSTNDFYVLAGERNTVEGLLGCTIEEGKQNFAEHSNNSDVPERILTYYEI